MRDSYGKPFNKRLKENLKVHEPNPKPIKYNHWGKNKDGGSKVVEILNFQSWIHLKHDGKDIVC